MHSASGKNLPSTIRAEVRAIAPQRTGVISKICVVLRDFTTHAYFSALLERQNGWIGIRF